jgi:hypothetical protein
VNENHFRLSSDNVIASAATLGGGARNFVMLEGLPMDISEDSADGPHDSRSLPVQNASYL